MSIPEDELWRLSQQGDSRAFGAIFDLHKDRVFRHAFRLTANRHEAEDITATAFLELWRKRSTVRIVDNSTLPWLLVTAAYSFRNSARASRRYRALIDSLPRDPSSEDPAEQALRSLPIDVVDPALMRALRALPVRDLQLLALVALEDFTIKEAAAAIGLSPAAAKSRLFRTRARLRTELDAMGIYERISDEISSREVER